jgi:hypothetical protein
MSSAVEMRRTAACVPLDDPGQKFTVDDVRAAAAAARDLEIQKQSLKERLSEVDYQLRTLYWRTLPDMMQSAGVDQVGVAAQGNLPAYDLTLEDHVSANIGVTWTEEKRNAALRWLEDNGHGDLIQTRVIADFPREERAAAAAFAENTLGCAGGKVEVSVAETVNPMTLRAWLRREMRAGRQLPPLDLIGAAIARVAKLKKRED